MDQTLLHMNRVDATCAMTAWHWPPSWKYDVIPEVQLRHPSFFTWRTTFQISPRSDLQRRSLRLFKKSSQEEEEQK